MNSNTVNHSSLNPVTNATLSTPDPHYHSYSTIELSIAQERLRQAHHSFNLALFITAVSACISLVGAGLMLSGKVPEGTVTSVGGLASSVRSIQLAKDANDRLDKVLAELKDET
nr:hypothetical protein [Nostoc sp. ChiQUE02]MDZ8232841.1 hypothetical protein [Nostoc sp. ChiQUE02]